MVPPALPRATPLAAVTPGALAAAVALWGLVACTVGACAKAATDISPPGSDGGADVLAQDDGGPAADARPDAPQGSCQLTTQERNLGAVPTGSGQQALAWDGTRLVTVYQVQPSDLELRFAASDGALTPQGGVATFTQGLVDCSLAVADCHAAPALWVDGAGSYTLVWAGYDPAHGAVGLHFGHLDANGTLSGHATPVAGGADPVTAADLRGANDVYTTVWQQGPAVRAAELDATGTASGWVGVSSAAETAERPHLAVVGSTTAVLYTWKTGSDGGKLVVRLRPDGGSFGDEVQLDLGLSRARGVALLALDGDLAVVLEGEAPAGHGWNAGYVAVLDPATGAVRSGPDPALLAPAAGGVVVESALVTPSGDIALGATVYDATDAHAVLQRVNRWGQGLHPTVNLSDGYPSVPPVGLGTQVAWTTDRYAVSFVAAPVADAGVLYLRTVTCDF